MRVGLLPAAETQPTVLVVVPCYNYGHYLPACVDSILGQTGVSPRVLIIDDASTDDSASVARALAARDDRIEVVVHTANVGHIGTYNEGLSSAETTYVVLLSADDLLAPGALGRAVRVMESDPRIGLVYGHPQNFEGEPDPTPSSITTWTAWTGPEWIDRQFRRGLSIIYSPEAVVRTAAHRQAGWYRPELPHSGDLEMWLRLADVAHVARINGPDQAYRRVHEASMMHTAFATPLADLEQRRAAYESFLDRSSLPAARVARLRRTMQKRLAAEAIGWACDRLSEPAPLPGAEIDRCLAFALATWDGAHRLSGVRELALRRSPSSAAGDRIRIRLGSAARNVAGRLRWRRWRYLGT
ncbi:glycosyltransferase [Microbacterium sp. cx-55]|uniref:glycosyltransferase family 2 protein n=1 Tax=Microbacterium sp. cx-55 TaxID=2875948 RepID=UPI001CBEC586|nr:glycosyltransferase family 2 protein [Microbacterium sp. cx-55]MBZ4486902.1 glycosyltransferase [Microbacterium sp. cx-55]UGB35825.1 glycosyltransferase [Microbacterium sp. cx-55]